MSHDIPIFESKFLSHLAKKIAKSRKVLKSHGEVTWETQQPDDFEWLTVNFTPLVGNYCIFQFIEDNRACIFVRSKSRSNRGKILLAIEDINVVDNADDIFGAMRATIDSSSAFTLTSEGSNEAVSLIRNAWSRVECRIATNET